MPMSEGILKNTLCENSKLFPVSLDQNNEDDPFGRTINIGARVLCCTCVHRRRAKKRTNFKHCTYVYETF